MAVAMATAVAMAMADRVTLESLWGHFGVTFGSLLGQSSQSLWGAEKRYRMPENHENRPKLDESGRNSAPVAPLGLSPGLSILI